MDNLHLSETEKDELIRLEEAMWREATRFDPAFQQSRFAGDFFEFGRSGKIHARAQIISSLPQPIGAVLPWPDLAIRMLDVNTAQITYTSKVQCDRGCEYARRSSIWTRTFGGWVIRFHQGTPCAG